MTVFNAFMKVIKKHIGSIIMYTCIFLSIAISISKNNTNNTIENLNLPDLILCVLITATACWQTILYSIYQTITILNPV